MKNITALTIGLTSCLNGLAANLTITPIDSEMMSINIYDNSTNYAVVARGVDECLEQHNITSAVWFVDALRTGDEEIIEWLEAGQQVTEELIENVITIYGSDGNGNR